MSALPETWLTDYDVYHLGLSGGKDSTAAMLWAVHESGIDPAKLVVSFSDTGNEDILTYAWINYLSQNVHPVTFVQPPLDFWDLARKKKMFPARTTRFCTSELKIHPSLRFIWKLKEKRGEVLVMSGIRREEGKSSNDRGDLPKFGYSDDYGCDKYLPIYEWSLEQVWDAHKRYLSLDATIGLVEDDPVMCPATKALLIAKIRRDGIPRSPLYAMGARRVGCFPCIFSAKAEIRAMAKYRPERIDFIESKEGSFVGGMYSTMFAAKTVPLAHRGGAEMTTKAGKHIKLATIRDVVRWSKTKRGGKQFEMDLDYDDTLRACGVNGMCE